MLKPKQRIKKKELKEDPFVKRTLQVKTYLDENAKQVFGVVSGILLLVIIFIVMVYWNRMESEEAAAQLGIAQIEYNNLNYEKAASRLQVVIEDYSSTNEADQALFLLASIRYAQEKYDEAQNYFEEFVSSYSGSNILLASGKAGLAACLEKADNYYEAAASYLDAAETAPDYVESDNYRYLAGICFQKCGETDKAVEQFEKIVAESKITKTVDDAKARLILIRGNTIAGG